jgi:hypothetical protein
LSPQTSTSHNLSSPTIAATPTSPSFVHTTPPSSKNKSGLSLSARQLALRSVASLLELHLRHLQVASWFVGRGHRGFHHQRDRAANHQWRKSS